MKELYSLTSEIIKERKKQQEENDALPEEEVEKWARFILDRVGLDITDLKGKRILDLGCGPTMLERYARKNRIDIVSLDEEILAMSQKSELKGRVVGDARKLPFHSESFDLIISTGAAPPYFGSFGEEIDTISCMEEIRRTLKKGGEARITPSDFGFLNKFWERPENLQKSRKDFSKEEEKEMMRIEEEAREKSFQFLRDNGFPVEKIPAKRKGKFWLMKKPDISADEKEIKRQSLLNKLLRKLKGV